MAAAGVPDSTPVDALKVTPLGRAPDSVSVGAGKPVAVTVKLFETRDCSAVGVQEIVFPLSVAPVGSLVKEKVTAVPVAATW